MKQRSRFKRLMAALGMFLPLFLLINIFCIDHSFGKKPADDEVYAKVWVEFPPEWPTTISPNPSIPCCNGFSSKPGKKGGWTGVMAYAEYVDLSYFAEQTFKVDDDGARCFGSPPVNGFYFNGLMPIVLEDDGSITVVITFYSSAEDIPSDLGYRLLLYGSVPENVDFPPAEAGDTTIWIDSWEIETYEGKGKAKRLSCTGSGEFEEAFTITVTRGPNESPCINTP